MARSSVMTSVLALLALAVVPALAKLAAFDLGGNFLKVAVVQPGRKPISIAENEMSRRQTPIMVGFVNGQRVLGEDAVTASARHPDKFVEHLRDLIGRTADDPYVQQLMADNFRQYDVQPDPERGTILVNVPGEQEPFSIEELMASELAYAHQTAAANTGAPKLSVVLVVPPHYGPSQRQALLDAAALAELDVLALVHSTAAASLQYGIERDFAGRVEQQVLVDIGASDAIAALVEYSAYNVSSSPKPLSQVAIRDVAWSDAGGTGRLDAALMRHFAAEFEAQAGVAGVLSSGKAAAKLRRAVRRTKEMLTANTEAPLNVEELYDGRDFSGSVTRATLEELLGGYWDAVQAPLAQLIERNGLGAGDAAITVQTLGGGSRVPAARAALAAAHPRVQLEKQLDASEAFALGAGLHAANLSTTFKLRRFGVLDAAPFAVSVSLDAGGAALPGELQLTTRVQKYAADAGGGGGKEVFPPMARLDWRRRASFAGLSADPFHLTLSYTGSPTPCCLPEGGKYVTYTVTGLKDVLAQHDDTQDVLARFHLDGNGMVKITHVEALRVFNETETTSKQVVDEEAEAEAAQAEEAAAAAAAANKTEAGAGDLEGNATAENSTAEAAKKERRPIMKTVQVPKTVTRRVNVPLKLSVQHHGIPPMPEAQKRKSITRLAEFAAREAAKREIEKARNELESYIVNTRSKLGDDEIAAVTTEEQREAFRALLTDAEDWLYMDPEAERGTAETFQNKLKALTATGDPIKERAYEAARRPERESGAKLLIDLVKKAAKDWPKAKPWLNATHVQRMTELNDEFETWLKDVTSKQTAQAPHEQPAYTISQLQDRFEVVSGMFTMLKDQKPPKDAGKKSKDAKADKDSTEAGEAAEGQADNEQAGAGGAGSDGGGEAQQQEEEDDSAHEGAWGAVSEQPDEAVHDEL